MFQIACNTTLEHGNRSTDAQLIDIAQREQRVVVTKDDDFVQSHLLMARPQKLWLVATGNISNAALEALLRKNLPAIEGALRDGSFVELGRNAIIVHR